MINIQLLRSYIKHRFRAKTRHGVHSPFVYKLVDEVIYDFSQKNQYTEIELLRKQLLSDERMITITDHGAGSHVNNNKQKKVQELAKNALKPPKLAQLIYRLINGMDYHNIVELGTCLGLTTAYLAKAAPEAKVISIEGCPETAAVASENLNRLHVENADIRTGNFDKIFPELLAELPLIDVLFVDGNHRKEATLSYFKWALPKMTGSGMMIFDDIYWSKGMEEAWEEIKQHPDVTVTVDLFWIGLVYFKKGQAREHFKIKF